MLVGLQPVNGITVHMRDRNSSHAELIRGPKSADRDLTRLATNPFLDMYYPPKMVSCQPLWALPVMSDMTCLMLVYSSNEDVDMSLPDPEALWPPWAIPLMIGMWSLIHTQTGWISRVARWAEHVVVHAEDASP